MGSPVTYPIEDTFKKLCNEHASNSYLILSDLSVAHLVLRGSYSLGKMKLRYKLHFTWRLYGLGGIPDNNPFHYRIPNYSRSPINPLGGT